MLHKHNQRCDANSLIFLFSIYSTINLQDSVWHIEDILLKSIKTT